MAAPGGTGFDLAQSRRAQAAHHCPMSKEIQQTDPQGAFCEACLKLVPRAEALPAEGRDYVAYFCGRDCYDRWHRQRATRQHSQRDEPKADSVEPDELPPA